MSKSLRKVLSLMCALAMVLGMFVLPGNIAYATESEMPSEGKIGDNEITSDELVNAEEITPTYNEVTFSDFENIKDYVIPGSQQISKPLTGADTLDGVAFNGYFRLQKQSDLRYSFRIGGKLGTVASLWSGVGMWPEASDTITFQYFSGDITHLGRIAQVPIKDYGITYNAATDTYSEFKLRVTFDNVEGTTDMKVSIYLNDKLAVDQFVLADAQNLLGTRVNVWTNGGKTMGVRSVREDTATYNELTFADFGILDQKTPSGVTISGSKAGITTADGIAFTGMVDMGYAADKNHYIRIGGNTALGGVSLWTQTTSQLSAQFFTKAGGDAGNICAIPIADYGVTYNAETNRFSTFKLRVTFDYLTETVNTCKVKIYVNDFLVCDKDVVGGQVHFGNYVSIHGAGESIAVSSVSDQQVPNKNHYEVTFADFGIADQIVNNAQAGGKLAAVTNLDGIAFTGRVKMTQGNNGLYHSVRLGGQTSGDVAWAGLGLRAYSTSVLSLYYYTKSNGGMGDVAAINIADYGITYDATDGFSEIKLRITFDYIENSNDVYITAFINDKFVCKGILLDAQNYFGNVLRVWASGNTIDIASEEVTATYNEVTFHDFGILDQTIPSSTQQMGAMAGITNMDGVAFTGNVQMSMVQHGLHSFRLGGKTGDTNSLWSGIGLRTVSNGYLAISRFTGAAAGNFEDLASIHISEYGITYDETTGLFSPIKLRIAFNYFGNSNVQITVSVNDKVAYSGILANAQDSFGNRLHIWTISGTIGVASITDGTEVIPGEYREVTFSDYGVDDQIINNGQAFGTLADVTSLDGIAFTGMVQMDLVQNIYHSFHIGGSGNVWYGIGLRTESESALQLYHYTDSAAGNALAKLPIADYGITYDAASGSFSPVKLRVTFDYIEGTKDVYVNISVNDKLVCNGILVDSQDSFGNRIAIWAHSGKTIAVESVGTEAAADMEVTGISVTLHEAISMNFHIAVADTENAKIQITVGDNDPIYKAVSERESVVVVELAAAQLTDSVTLQLLVNGEAKGEAYTTTGRDYAEAVLADAKYEAYYELVKHMLNYGAAAQVYFDHNATDLANKNVSVSAVAVPEGVPAVNVSSNVSGANFYGATLLFKSKTAVRFYFTGDVSGLTFLKGATMLEAKESDNGLYYVEVADINPQDLGNNIELIVCDTEGNMLTVSYSPLTYITRMYNGKGSANLKALLQAMYGYYDAAKNFVAA